MAEENKPAPLTKEEQEKKEAELREKAKAIEEAGK